MCSAVRDRGGQTTVPELAEPDRRQTPRGPGLCLVMLSGPQLGRCIELPPGDLTLGRESHCDVVVPLGGVSRVHCSIRRDGGGVWLRDLASTNGTQHNGVAVRPYEDVRLASGDVVAIGGAVLKVLDAEHAEIDYHAQVFRTLALDDLTRIHNRRKLQDALESEIARCRRHRHAFSLLLVDVDRFKEINDRYGHLCGDSVLQHIAKLLTKQGRRENCTARFGGDEFAIVLAETALAGAAVFAERVRSAIEAEAFGTGAARIDVTVSIGVAEWSPAMLRPEDLIAVADRALYDAKHAGRNRVASQRSAS